MTRGRRVSAAEFLDNDAVIAEYLGACLEDPNPDVFLSALAAVARAKGMTNVAHASGLGRESLYKALSPGAHPRHEAIQKVVHALGFTMTIIPATTEAREEAV